MDSVELKLEAGEIHVRLAHYDMIDWPCPECGKACKLHDHQAERQWRHVDTCQYRTILDAEPPRSQCSDHGVRVVKMPWAEPSSRFTAPFELLAIEWLKAASQKAVAGLLRLSWAQFQNVAGLGTGAPVRVAGIHEGTARSISLPNRPDGEVRVATDLQNQTRDVIKSDSAASIAAEGLVGDMYVEISFGSKDVPSVTDGEPSKANRLYRCPSCWRRRIRFWIPPRTP